MTHDAILFPQAAGSVTFIRIGLQHHEIVGADVIVVFAGLGSARRSALASGNYELDHSWVDAEGGRNFDGVERTDASAGAGANIDETTTSRETVQAKKGNSTATVSSLKALLMVLVPGFRVAQMGCRMNVNSPFHFRSRNRHRPRITANYCEFRC
jgi:hypothetical protein